MKRIKAACIQQTIHFQLKEDVGHDEALRLVREECAQYKANLDRRGTSYKILEEQTQPDGSIVVMLKKQYNEHSVGSYLD